MSVNGLYIAHTTKTQQMWDELARVEMRCSCFLFFQPEKKEVREVGDDVTARGSTADSDSDSKVCMYVCTEHRNRDKESRWT